MCKLLCRIRCDVYCWESIFHLEYEGKSMSFSKWGPQWPTLPCKKPLPRWLLYTKQLFFFDGIAGEAFVATLTPSVLTRDICFSNNLARTARMTLPFAHHHLTVHTL